MERAYILGLVNVNMIIRGVSRDDLTRLREALEDFSVCFYYVFKTASRHGIETVLSANGMDELFCGYNFSSVPIFPTKFTFSSLTRDPGSQ